MKRRMMIYLVIPLMTILCNAGTIVRTSYYNPVRGQGSGNPLITADGSRINLNNLKNGGIRWVAVSRDLLSDYRLGDTIIVETDNPHFSGLWVIHDKMGPRHKKRIDFLLHKSDKHIPPRKVTIHHRESSK